MQNELKRASGSFDSLLALSLSVKEDTYCFHDTEDPEAACRLAKRFAGLWQSLLAAGLPAAEVPNKESIDRLREAFEDGPDEVL